VLHSSGHNLQLDIERETVFALVANFVARVTRDPESARS
jgi:esterase/lipase